LASFAHSERTHEPVKVKRKHHASAKPLIIHDLDWEDRAYLGANRHITRNTRQILPP
jgi:hypothetical protein